MQLICVCCTVIWFGVSLDLFIAWDETQAASSWLIRNTWYVGSFRLALTKHSPLLCRCPPPSSISTWRPEGEVKCVFMFLPPCSNARSAKLLLFCFPSEPKQPPGCWVASVYLAQLSNSYLEYHKVMKIQLPIYVFTWYKCLMDWFGFSRNKIRLSCLTGRAEQEHSLEGSLRDLPLTQADPGNLLLQLSCKGEKAC